MKIGDYCRTKDGIIGKIESKNYIGYSDWLIDTLYYKDDEIINDWTCGIKEYDVIKSSSNILDLIEEHDILKIEEQKGIYTICEVEVFKEPHEKYTFLGVRIDNRPIVRKLYELNIKSIVTHEQFSSIGYKVVE